ncbi:MAG: helix-turn-helix transcriptional regulator, partial [Clostridiales bacterium]|nr:helix-turn-helix transcriptional regulator [Clostridiales bacterium]
IASHFTISKPSVSRHLEVLRQAELVTVERRGTQLIYSVNLTVLQEMGMELIELVSTKERVSNEP